MNELDTLIPNVAHQHVPNISKTRLWLKLYRPWLCPGENQSQEGCGGNRGAGINKTIASWYCKSTTVLCRSKAIICSVPKSSWKRKQIERSENRAMKELEREMREAAKREREVCSNWQLVTS